MSLNENIINAKLIDLQTELANVQLECQQLQRQLSVLSTMDKQKGELINNIKSEIDRLEKNTSLKEIKINLGRLKREINYSDSLKNNWDYYSKYFEKSNQDFIKKISKLYPSLTAKDHRLCLYLKMNLTTKEIAPLMNISIRGVEISRYRLRKKLKLNSKINLNDFLLNL